MFVVVFTAEISTLDDAYQETADRMRALAFERYGCLGFNAVTEGRQEIAVSYWPNLSAIAEWRKNAEHLAAQKQGQSKWYRHYKVEVAEVVRQYDSQKN